MSARIYVACLAAYNGGALHGEWIDASSDTDEMYDEIQEVLASSPRAFDQIGAPAELRARHPHRGNADAIARFNARRAQRAGKPCPAHTTEEWAIHDTEGLPGVGEYSSISEVAEMMALIEEHDGELVRAVLSHCDSTKEAREMLEERWHCSAESRDDLAFEILGEVPERLVSYIDVEAVLRDFDCGGGLIIEVGGMVHAFS